MEDITNNIVEFKIIFLCSIFIILVFNVIISCFNFCYFKLRLHNPFLYYSVQEDTLLE